MTSRTELTGFELGVLRRVRATGPLAWAKDWENPVNGITTSERQAMRRLLKGGFLVTEYADGIGKSNDGSLVIREPLIGPVQPQKPKVIGNDDNSPGYLETPALIALRERRRRLGR